jgi:hypothetical protein
VDEIVVYTFTVTNVGNTPLLNVQVVDDHTGPPILVSGDDGDSQLELAEVWVYTAAYTIPSTDADLIANTVSVTATDAADTQATDTDQHSTQLSAFIYCPLFLRTSGPNEITNATDKHIARLRTCSTNSWCGRNRPGCHRPQRGCHQAPCRRAGGVSFILSSSFSMLFSAKLFAEDQKGEGP